jgi:two-component system phosphate regulon response regulator PhoB
VPTPEGNFVILVQERDPLTARFLHSLLAAAGFEVTGVADADEAYRVFLSDRPSLVIANPADTSGDGLGLLRAVRRDTQLAQTPFIVLSERAQEAEVVRAFEAGADDYVVKPFYARELVARVRRCLERARGRA